AAPGTAKAWPWLDGFELGLLGAIWGASFLFQRISAPEFGALPLGEIRLALGALVLLPFLWRDRAAFPLRIWPRIVLVGAINSAVPFALFAWAAQRAPAGVIAISNSMAVLLLAPFAVASWPGGTHSGIAWAAAIALGVVCSGVAYALYYRLIQRIGGARAVTVTYLVPLFAVAWAWMLLGEVPTLAMLAA